jgi:lipopolysaccharide biosynthesis protein
VTAELRATREKRARLIAYYLPQYHVIPENERWWGEEFTDWVNVRRARPLFEGHYQPRIPLDGNYYDLTDVDTLHWQVDLAKRFGLSGFCHYHYWFNGRRLLERPTDLFIARPELDFPFCLAWINASWSRRWNGARNTNPLLVKQSYSSERTAWMNHFEYLFNAWSNERHLTVDGKPIFLIYNPHLIPDVGELLDFWRAEAERRGLRGVYFVAMHLFAFLDDRFLMHFDAAVESQPSAAMFIPRSDDSVFSSVSLSRYLRGLPSSVAEPLRALRYKLPRKLNVHDYDELWQRIVESGPLNGKRTYPGAFVDWDNTARYGMRGRVVKGANPNRFRYWLTQLVDSLQAEPPDHRLIFINAWNEWAEGAYLEPDERFGYAYLEAVAESLAAEAYVRPSSA